MGYVLHYNDDALANTVFINPEWISKGLYRILRAENYRPEAAGHFSKNDIHTIWKEKEYSLSERNLLLSLLLKDRFEVCYKVENSDDYLVPVLISDDRKAPPAPPSGKPYTVRFKFPFMPFGFFSRLTVRLFDKILNDYVWLTGVWLNTGTDCTARLEHFKDIKTGDEVFEISLYGEKQKRITLLTAVREEIFHIRKLLFPNLTVEELIPCSCDTCVSSGKPYFHYRSDLDTMLARNQYQSQCKNSGELIHIATLLDSIINTEELQKQMKAMAKEGMHFENHNHFENINNSEIHAMSGSDLNDQSNKTIAPKEKKSSKILWWILGIAGSIIAGIASSLVISKYFA